MPRPSHPDAPRWFHRLGWSRATGDFVSSTESLARGESDPISSRGSGSVHRVSRRPRGVTRPILMVFTVGVLVYSVAVLAHVAWMGTIGVRCMFGTEVEEEVPEDFDWSDGH